MVFPTTEKEQKSRFEFIVLGDEGYYPSLFGLGFSWGVTSELDYGDFLLEGNDVVERMVSVANKLKGKDTGENKYLEGIYLWLNVRAPRYWWQEMATYRHTTVLSESTMHTLTREPVTPENFEYCSAGVLDRVVADLNDMLAKFASASNAWEKERIFLDIKALLPDGYLQRRLIVLNYKEASRIINQRAKHRLPQWKSFIKGLRNSCKHPNLLPETE